MYAHKPTSESLNPAASLTNVRNVIHEPLRPAKDAAIHTTFRGDSKSLPKIGLQRYEHSLERERLSIKNKADLMLFNAINYI